MSASPAMARETFVIREQPFASNANSAILYGVFGLLLFGVLAFGATDPLAAFVLEIGSALLFAFWIALQVKSGELVIRWNPLFAPMLCFACIVMVQLASGSSAYSYATFSAALLYGAYGLVCFAVAQCLRSSRQLRTLAVMVSAFGLAVAVFALLQSLTSNGKIYWMRTVPLISGIYGPYVNHNHYAGLMEMLVPVPLVACFSRRVPKDRKIVASLTAAFMASTIFLSGSRGGMVAFAAEMVVLSAIVLGQKHCGRALPTLGIFVVAVVGLLIWLGRGEVLGRLTSVHLATSQELSEEVRLAIERDGLRMVARKPVLGWGLGVFPVVYPQFSSFYSSRLIDQAHNDYLQLLAEMGTAGFGLMLWFLILVYRRALRKVNLWPLDTNGAAALAAMLGVTGILVHSFVDFNLQIQANAALFYVLCTIAAMEPDRLRLAAGRR